MPQPARGILNLSAGWQHDNFALLSRAFAGIAQLVEQLICNQQAVGSNPTAGSLDFRLASSTFLGMIC